MHDRDNPAFGDYYRAQISIRDQIDRDIRDRIDGTGPYADHYSEYPDDEEEDLNRHRPPTAVDDADDEIRAIARRSYQAAKAGRLNQWDAADAVEELVTIAETVFDDFLQYDSCRCGRNHILLRIRYYLKVVKLLNHFLETGKIKI